MSIVAESLLVALTAASVAGLGRAGSMLPSDRAAEAARAYQAFRTARYFGGLDALRAFSVIAVIWVHTTPQHAIGLLNQGRRGVDLFFAISGFLVTTLLLREYRRRGSISLRDFYVRRTLRIFPLYYAVLALYCTLAYLLLRGTPKAEEFWGNLPAFLSYTANWFVESERASAEGVTFYFAWSLATEEQFYLLWPVIMVLVLQHAPRPLALVAPVTALLLVQMAGAAMGRSSFAGTVMGSIEMAILFGVLFAVLMDDESTFGGIYRLLGNRWAAVIAALGMLACLAMDAPWHVGSFCMAVLVACVCLREDTYLHTVLRYRPLVYVGTISYGIYLMHMLAANVSRKVLGHDFGTDVFVLTVPIVIAAATASYFLFERPVLRFKSLFSRLPDTSPATSPAPAEAGVAAALGASLGVTSPLPK